MKRNLFLLFIVIFVEIFCIITCYAGSEESNLQENYEELKTQYNQLKQKYKAILNGQIDESSKINTSTSDEQSVRNTRDVTDSHSPIDPLYWIIIIIEFVLLMIKSRQSKKLKKRIVETSNTIKEHEETLLQKELELTDANNLIEKYRNDSSKLKSVLNEKQAELQSSSEKVNYHKSIERNAENEHILYWPRH